ncbi:hypothetical protein [Kitasatospora griseola]|uniref:hypothetical protein n=1 Tax=Kitasatospora griseola TaxID=2064 RepID=UPI00343C878E
MNDGGDPVDWLPIDHEGAQNDQIAAARAELLQALKEMPIRFWPSTMTAAWALKLMNRHLNATGRRELTVCQHLAGGPAPVVVFDHGPSTQWCLRCTTDRLHHALCPKCHRPAHSATAAHAGALLFISLLCPNCCAEQT